jgi:hypothetical protein
MTKKGLEGFTRVQPAVAVAARLKRVIGKKERREAAAVAG